MKDYPECIEVGASSETALESLLSGMQRNLEDLIAVQTNLEYKITKLYGSRPNPSLIEKDQDVPFKDMNLLDKLFTLKELSSRQIFLLNYINNRFGEVI